MVKLKIQDFNSLDKRYRANLINSLSGFKSANLIGTADKNKNTNLSVFSSTFHLGADPALVGIISRPNTVPRDTIENIKETGFFTINHISKDFIKKAHQTSARYEKFESEFQKVGLAEEWGDGHNVPYVLEARIKFLCELKEINNIKFNNTDFVIGEIKEAIYPETCVLEDGSLDLIKAESVWVSGLNCYGIGDKAIRLSYAKSDKEIQEI